MGTDYACHAAPHTCACPPRDRGELTRFAKRTTEHRTVTSQGIEELEPALADRYSVGLFFQSEAHLDPRRALHDLSSVARTLGVEVCFDAPAPEQVDPAYQPAATSTYSRNQSGRWDCPPDGHARLPSSPTGQGGCRHRPRWLSLNTPCEAKWRSCTDLICGSRAPSGFYIG